VSLSKLTKILFTSILLFWNFTHGAKYCQNELLSVSVDSQTTTKEILQTISSYCSKSLVIKDAFANAKLQEELFGINIIDQSLDDILQLLLVDKELFYEHKNHIIKIYGLHSQTFEIDYVNSTRGVTSNTDVSLSANQSTTTSTSDTTKIESGSQIKSSEKFDFWDTTLEQVTSIVNTASDDFNATNITLNKESGLLTITATKRQLQRVARYIHKLTSRLHKQVLIDVNMMYVTLNNSNNTGIDWSQFFAQSISVGLDYEDIQSDSTFTSALSGSFTLSSVINFLKTIGDVSSISNPKILTLNNQPAIISSGEEIFYKTTATITLNNDTGNVETDESVESIFAGVLLDITPAITDQDEIILKINPSISALKNPNETTSGVRTIPPDLLRKQLSSVVRLKNGQRVILGGLIERNRASTTQSVPILGDLPIFGIPFRQSKQSDQTKELVIILTPHIIKSDKEELSLKNLGFHGVQYDFNSTNSQ
jgi:general secretion pathway protein D